MSLPHIVPQPSPIVYPDAEPGVYRCGRRVAGRWAYFALGPGGVLVGARRPREGETDAEVVSGLRSLYLAAVRAPMRLIGPSGEVRPLVSSRQRRRRDPAPPR